MSFLYKVKGALLYASKIYYAHFKDFVSRLFHINNFKYSKDVKELAICIVCKDDEECLKENIEYHSLIGVEHFIIYDNNSQRPLKDALKKYKNVTVINWPYKLRQFSCYQDCLNKFKTKFKWIAFIDTDEFIVMKDRAIDLKDFLKPYRKYGGLAINWLCFGSSGHLKQQKKIINNFTEAKYNHNQNNYIKSIVNTKHVLCASRNPHGFFYKKGYFCVNENFQKLSAEKTRWLHAPQDDSVSYNKIQINHYITRSREDFELKRIRCKNNASFWSDKLSDEFWESFQNGKKDTAILDLIKKIKKNKKV